MIDYLTRLRREVIGSYLARASLVAIVAVPVLTWVIVTGSRGELFVRMFLSNFAAAVQLIVLPFIPSDLRNQVGRSLEANELAVLVPATLVLATIIALVLAAIRNRYGRDFTTSIVIGYLAAIAGLQIVGAVPWIMLALLLRNVGPY